MSVFFFTIIAGGRSTISFLFDKVAHSKLIFLKSLQLLSLCRCLTLGDQVEPMAWMGNLNRYFFTNAIQRSLPYSNPSKKNLGTMWWRYVPSTNRVLLSALPPLKNLPSTMRNLGYKCTLSLPTLIDNCLSLLDFVF